MDNGQEILPSYWSASYFSLAPGESITATVSASVNQLKGKNIAIHVEGWNIEAGIITLK